MRLTSLLALALLITGCSTVHVRDTPVDDYFAARRGDVLTTGNLSASSRETLLMLGLDARSCARNVHPCLDRLTDASALDEERRLATLAELNLREALAT